MINSEHTLIINAIYRYFVSGYEPKKAAFNNTYYEFNMVYFLEKCGHMALYEVGRYEFPYDCNNGSSE